MILIDNTVLSNFSLVENLLLLEEFCQGKGASTGHVFTEFQHGIDEGIFHKASLEWLKKVEIENRKEELLFKNLRNKLGAGEASSLAIAICRKYALLTDDMAARKIGFIEGVRISGSVGVLIELIRIGRINRNTGNNILKGFIDYGYYSPVDKLDDLL